MAPALVDALTKVFLDYFDSHPIGELFVARCDVVLSMVDIIEPDLLLVTNDQTGIIAKKNVRGAPALVIEINSPSTRTRDRRLKRELYARTGVREYWIVDPDTTSVSIFRRTPTGEFPLTATLRSAADDILATPLLPEFTLALSTLFRGL